MQAVTMYKANDGTMYSTESGARDHDSLIELVKRAMEILPSRPKDSADNEYIQHSRQNVIRCKTALFEIAKSGPLKWWIDGQKEKHGKTERDLIEITHPSWFGRMLDGGHDPLSRAYSRLCCIDSQNREWEQPYYVMNTPAGPKQINQAAD